MKLLYGFEVDLMFNAKGPLVVCILMGMILIGVGSQDYVAFSTPLRSTNTLLIIPRFQLRLAAAPGVIQNRVLQTGSTGQTIMIVAPAGSGVSLVNFSPSNVTLVIGVNNTIVLNNKDTADHTITSNPGDPVAFDTGDISGLSSSDPITFTTPGTYGYHCQFHPAYMKGTITVLAASS